MQIEIEQSYKEKKEFINNDKLPIFIVLRIKYKKYNQVLDFISVWQVFEYFL
jgi:hypothetical protein